MKRLFPVFGIFLVVALTYGSGALDFVERWLLDLRFRHITRPATGNVMLVSIDSESLRLLDSWPWPRGYHASVLETLLGAGADVVGFDVDFSSKSIAEEDAELEGALSRATGRVILPTYYHRSHGVDDARIRVVRPLPAYEDRAVLASIDMEPDSDGLTRRYLQRSTGDGTYPSFAVALSGIPSPDDFWIDYGIDPGTIPRISFVHALTGRFDPALMAGKRVIVGATAVELGDQLAVPRHRILPGPVVQAMAYESLIQDRALEPLSRGWTLVVVLMVGFAIGWPMAEVRWHRALTLAGIASAGLVGFSWFLQSATPWMIEISPCLMLIGGTIVWRTVRVLDQQSIRLLLQGQRIRHTEVRMQHIVEQSLDAILTLRCDGTIETFNPAAQRMFGRQAPGALAVHDLVQWAAENETAPASVDGCGGFLAEAEGLRPDGTRFPVEIAASTIQGEREGVRIFFVRDISDRKAHQNALEYQANHDALTRLPNRYMLRERMDSILTAAREKDGAVAFLILDLDRFKEINDTLGHQVGDLVLQRIGNRLHSALRPADTIARFGGDEFAVLLPSTDLNSARRVARRLIRALDRPFQIEDLALKVDTSVGIALFPHHGRDATMLIQRADVAMYVAKRSGVGISVYDPDEDFTSMRHLSLSADLRRAIETDQLSLHYQPKIAADTDTIVGVEALARWNHPDYGAVPPDEFVGLAEQNSMMGGLTRWVLRTALRQSGLWRRAGFDLGVAVNISAANLREDDLPAILEELLAETGVPPETLILEITESVIMDDPKRTLGVITSLAALGVDIAIDDFGTGYSSLGHLRNLPAREIKIDKSFVMEMDRNKDDATIVRSTIELAHNLGLRVVAEGVETQQIWRELKELGCDVGQGFLFSRPLVADELTERWQSRMLRVAAPGDEAPVSSAAG